MIPKIKKSAVWRLVSWRWSWGMGLIFGGGLCLGLLGAVWQPLAGSEIINHGHPSLPAVALTFDDGPSPRYTPKILELLAEYQAQATFFVLGRHAKQYPHLIQAIVADGHEIGNHSYNHLHLPKVSRRVLAAEIDSTHTLLTQLGIPCPGLFRPPYSEVSSQQEQYTAKCGQRLILWNINAGDYLGINGPEIANRVLQQISNGAIIVMHDSDEFDRADRQPTVEALRLLLPALKERGLRLLTVSALLNLPADWHLQTASAHSLTSSIPAPPPDGRQIP
jgi:peptidoglycan-N-acetylglucosamine deacetylase